MGSFLHVWWVGLGDCCHNKMLVFDLIRGVAQLIAGNWTHSKAPWREELLVKVKRVFVICSV